MKKNLKYLIPSTLFSLTTMMAVLNPVAAQTTNPNEMFMPWVTAFEKSANLKTQNSKTTMMLTGEAKQEKTLHDLLTYHTLITGDTLLALYNHSANTEALKTKVNQSTVAVADYVQGLYGSGIRDQLITLMSKQHSLLYRYVNAKRYNDTAQMNQINTQLNQVNLDLSNLFMKYNNTINQGEFTSMFQLSTDQEKNIVNARYYNDNVQIKQMKMEAVKDARSMASMLYEKSAAMVRNFDVSYDLSTKFHQYLAQYLK